MSGKFHINSNNESQPCHATVRACRFGEDNHFKSAADAKAESERRLEQEFGESKTLTKADKKNVKLAKSENKLNADAVEGSEVADKPKRSRKPTRPKGTLGKKVEKIDPKQFRALPFEEQVSTLAKAYGYKGTVPDKLTYYRSELASGRQTPGGSGLYAGDLVRAKDGRLGIYYKSPFINRHRIMDPMTGKSISNGASHNVIKVANITFSRSVGMSRLQAPQVDFDIYKELEKNDPYTAEVEIARAEHNNKQARLEKMHQDAIVAAQNKVIADEKKAYNKISARIRRLFKR